MKVLTILLLASFLEFVSTYKVLVFNPTYGESHSNFLGKISDILIDAGHDVTMLIPIFLGHKRNLVGSKKVKKIIKIEQDPRITDIQESTQVEELFKKRIWKMKTERSVFFSLIGNFSLAGGYQCENLFQQASIIANIREEKYDLGLSEGLFICGYAFFDHVGIKSMINADSVLMMDVVKKAIGESAATSFYPGPFGKMTDEMEFLDRFMNLVGHVHSLYSGGLRSSRELEVIKPYYENAKTADELLGGIAFNMINSNKYIDYPSPVLPKTVFVGGMQVDTKKNGNVKLSKEWEKVLNKRNTTVLVSFGSNAFSSDMPDEFKSAFLNVFESMPDTTFIWKYEIANTTIADHLPNVILSTWMPQNDLLADDRLSLFVTHGGLGSSMELAYQGKPAVVIPLMADQPRNAHMLTRHGGAIQLDKTKLNDPAEIKNAIETILRDENYKKNAKKLAQILESQPNQPKDVVLKHCDFAVKFGPLETLNSSGRHLSTIQYYSFDILLVLCFTILVIVSIIFVTLRAVFRRCFRNSAKSKED